MDGAVIFFFVLAAIIVIFVILALISVSRTKSNTNNTKDSIIAGFKQKLIDINKVPDPKGRGTLWVPDE